MFQLGWGRDYADGMVQDALAGGLPQYQPTVTDAT